MKNRRRVPPSTDNRSVSEPAPHQRASNQHHADRLRVDESGAGLCWLLTQLQAHTDALYELARVATDRAATEVEHADGALLRM